MSTEIIVSILLLLIVIGSIIYFYKRKNKPIENPPYPYPSPSPSFIYGGELIMIKYVVENRNLNKHITVDFMNDSGEFINFIVQADSESQPFYAVKGRVRVEEGGILRIEQ